MQIYSDSLVRPLTCLALLLAAFFSAIIHAAPLPAPPQLSARSFLLIDNISGEVLAEKNPDGRIEPASLTKLMTAYIVASEIRQGTLAEADPAIVSEYAQSMPQNGNNWRTVARLDCAVG